MAAAGRGRRQGYNNYSIQEQMLLCTTVEEILPLGRNMWERVADRFNANRTRGTPERDWASLRRKFRNLYGKPKPTGRNSTPRMNPIILAKEIQHKIERQGGAITSHDGLDEVEDDETFEQTVDEASANEEQRGAVVAQQGLVAETNGGLEELGQRLAHENYAPDSDRESAGRGEEAVNTEHHDGIPAACEVLPTTLKTATHLIHWPNGHRAPFLLGMAWSTPLLQPISTSRSFHRMKTTRRARSPPNSAISSPTVVLSATALKGCKIPTLVHRRRYHSRLMLPRPDVVRHHMLPARGQLDRRHRDRHSKQQLLRRLPQPIRRPHVSLAP
ncbi:hypothetical protein PR003_g21473 [Phytophthora rubi]|uniref:DUF6818 domain-containing protein n=1 Tax=Phytophthora rubi TaxID=129364 RepID=A0A6A3JJQ3_9STRA|nr:hypothetical protein PR001_g20284 [Phytophthora rubi]KAE9305511.1 hypothetical protein PR003_g21473 [Phytophthora rubi]